MLFIGASAEDYPSFEAVPDREGTYYWVGGENSPEDCVSEEESMRILSLILPNEIQWSPLYNEQFEALEAYIVEDQSSNLKSEEGVLFSKDMRILLSYPKGKKDATYVVPESVIYISDHAFSGNTYLEKIDLGTQVQIIGDSAFYKCSSLLSISFNEQLKCINDNAFAYCLALHDIILPQELKIIGYHAFYMSGLRSIKLNEGIECIMGEAFFNHQLFESDICLPQTILYIDRTIFMPNSDVSIFVKEGDYLTNINALLGVKNIIVIPKDADFDLKESRVLGE